MDGTASAAAPPPPHCYHRRLRHQLDHIAASQPRRTLQKACACAGITQPMAPVEPKHEIEASAMQYHQSGYTILRNVVPVEMLKELQRRFDHHAKAHAKSLDPDHPRGRLTFYELNDDTKFTELAELLTHHPVLVRCAELSWLRPPEVDHKPYGSVLHGGEPSDGSWHVDAQGPLALYADSEADPPEPREPGIYSAPQPPSPFPERNGIALIPFMLRASVLMSDTTDDMGPTCLLPGSHGSRHMPPPWVHSGSTACSIPNCPGCFHCATAPAQPRVLPGMIRFTGHAGDVLLNNVSIWHTSGPNTSAKTRKLCWVLWRPKGGYKK